MWLTSRAAQLTSQAVRSTGQAALQIGQAVRQTGQAVRQTGQAVSLYSCVFFFLLVFVPAATVCPILIFAVFLRNIIC